MSILINTDCAQEAEKGSGLFSQHSGLEFNPSRPGGRRLYELADGIGERTSLTVIPVHIS